VSSVTNGIVYIRNLPESSASITYIDPKNPPGHKALLLRGLLETAWSLIFSTVLIPTFCLLNSVLESANLPHVHVVIAGFLGALVTWLIFLPLFLLSAKETKQQFVEFGGNDTGMSLLMFCGMMPTNRGHWQRYQFLPPDRRNKWKTISTAKPVTNPFF
jgi:hypothetical protein